MPLISAFVFGVVFALGLGLGGMTQPARVIGFLDVAGRWDPTLLFVLGGAVTTSFVLFPVILRRGAPVLGPRFVMPTRTRIDGRLLGGAALFGAGWGLAGYCPGPAVVSLVAGTPATLVFVVAMGLGLVLGQQLSGEGR
jgi:hypothetical protein